jgi:hypothetical protein
MSQWMKCSKEAPKYCGDISQRTFEKWLRRGLRYVKVKGTRLTTDSWCNDFMEGHEVETSSQQVGNLADSICRGLTA